MSALSVATIKLSGGHPVLDFVNTLDSRGAEPGPDVLTDFGSLASWAVRAGVIGAAEESRLHSVGMAQGEAALGRAKVLREAIYRIFAAPSSAAADDLALLQRWVGAAQSMRVLAAESGGFAWRWRDGDPDAVAHRIAIAAADLLTSRQLGRVHVCAGENCDWLFLDASRSARRIWCSEETCGTRNRVRRWRRQQQPG
jgi:predicted RNA-binding Zn ribbon-like protein